jgi:hypothetical protein
MATAARMTHRSKVLVATPNPEDAQLCRDVFGKLHGVMALHRRDDDCTLSLDERRAWGDAMLDLATHLLVVSRTEPSAYAQLEILRALEAGKDIKIVMPHGVELSSEFMILARCVGKELPKPLRWDKLDPRDDLAATIARLYTPPSWYSGPYFLHPHRLAA